MDKKTYIFTYDDITSTMQGINMFLRQDLPVMLSLDFTRTLRILKDHAEDFNAALEKIRGQYIKKNKDGSAKADENNQVIFKSDKAREQFQEDVKKLRAKEVEVELTDPPTKEHILDFYEVDKANPKNAQGTIIEKLYPLIEPRIKASK